MCPSILLLGHSTDLQYSHVFCILLQLIVSEFLIWISSHSVLYVLSFCKHKSLRVIISLSTCVAYSISFIWKFEIRQLLNYVVIFWIFAAKMSLLWASKELRLCYVSCLNLVDYNSRSQIFVLSSMNEEYFSTVISLLVIFSCSCNSFCPIPIRILICVLNSFSWKAYILLLNSVISFSVSYLCTPQNQNIYIYSPPYALTSYKFCREIVQNKT